MYHVRLDPTRLQPARQPEAVAAGFEGQRNPGDSAAGPDRLITPAIQHGKQPFWPRLQLVARLTLNTRKYAGNQPARLAQFDDGNDRAVLVYGESDRPESFAATRDFSCMAAAARSRRSRPRVAERIRSSSGPHPPAQCLQAHR
jgi:hypothetical protein